MDEANNRAVVSIHIGQAGVQIGNSLWELFGFEHGLFPDGFMTTKLTECTENDFINTFYSQAACERYVPRSVFVDLDPTTIDEIRNGQYRDLFHPDKLVSGSEDASNNYARGYYTVGQDIIDRLEQVVRRECEMCTGLAGFIIYRSAGGGTASGLSALLQQRLTDMYPKTTKLEFIVYPSHKLSTAMVEPYNAIFGTHSTIEHSNCAFLMDNEALYNIVTKYLDLDKVSYVDLNRIISVIVSGLTASLRFGGSLNIDLCEFETNLVPFPRIHYPQTSYAPFITRERGLHENVTIQELTSSCFTKSNQLVSTDPTRGCYMSCCLLYRGRIAPKDVTDAINNVKRKGEIKFVDWCPTGFKVSINNQSPMMVCDKQLNVTDSALCTVANTTSIGEAWAHLDYKFDLMYAKRAFVHWYLGEGMEEGEFLEAREDLASLEKDYELCATESNQMNEPPTTEVSTQGSQTTATDDRTRINKSAY